MSVIVLKGIPTHFNKRDVTASMSNVLDDGFQVLSVMNKGHGKTCYIYVPETQCPFQAIEAIKNHEFDGHYFTATILKDIPIIPPSEPNNMLSNKLHSPAKILELTHKEIMTELNCKYTGLSKLNQKTGNKLMDSIALTVLERLKEIFVDSINGKKLNKKYRIRHPSFGDFQLILSALHQIEDIAGQPRTQVNRAQLEAAITKTLIIGNVSYDAVNRAHEKYSNRIVNKIQEHIRNLKTDSFPQDTEGEVKRVHDAFKKLSPQLPLIMKEIVKSHFVPKRALFYQIRVYGEPMLPPMLSLKEYFRRYCPINYCSSYNISNLLTFAAPLCCLDSLLARDGTFLANAKLTIRLAYVRGEYKASHLVKKAINSAIVETERRSQLGSQLETKPQPESHEMAIANEEWLEQW